MGRIKPMILYLLCLLIGLVKNQQVITLTNTTYLKDYTSSTTFEHLSFDVPLQERGKLVDYDDSNVYTLGRRSLTDLSHFYFQTISQSTLSVTNQSLSIPSYKLSGMCQYKGTLDYFIGVHTDTGEIRVCNLDTSESPHAPLYCKTVPITAELVDEHIYADCRYIDTINDKNVYIIGIGGSSFDLAHPGQYNYVYAKFNTFYNFTETVVESNDPDVSERLVDIKVDPVHEQVYVVLDINSNTYKDVSIYEAGEEITLNNPNVAIIAYDFKNAVINWMKVLGDKNYVDYYIDLEVNGNYVIIATNSYTMNFSKTVPTKDILVYKLKYKTGYQDGKLVLGSSVDDIAYELAVHYQGMYILALIGDNFWPHPTAGAVWGTPNDGTVFGLIWISNEFELVDIEGYAEANLDTIPWRVFPSLSGKYFTQFTFLSPASKTQKHGALYTHFADVVDLYSSVDCNLTCPYCNRYTKQEDCLSCESSVGLYLFQGSCDSSCPDFSYSISGTYICAECDYNCKTCSGPKDDQCASCCDNGDCGTSILDKTPNAGTCSCPSGTYESHGNCLSKCENGLYARLDDTCYEQCPRNTYPEIIWNNPTTANEITHYVDANDTDCVDYDHVLKFSITGNGIEVPGPKELVDVPDEFTLSFWFRAELFGNETYLLNLFDRIFIKAASMKIFFRFKRSSGDYIEPIYSGTLNQISYNKWVYVSVSQKEHKEAGIHQITQKMVIANGRTATAVEAASKTDHTTATFSDFTNKIFIGGYSYSQPKSFTGYIKEIRFFNKFHDSPQMIVDHLKAYQVHTFDDRNLIAYWKLSEAFFATDSIQEIKDYSVYSLEEPLTVTFSPSTNPDYPTFVYNITLGLKLCFYHDVAICKGVKNLPQVFSVPWRIANAADFTLASWTHTMTANDQVLFKSGDCETGATMAKMTLTNSLVWDHDVSLHPKDLEDGKYYSTCYITAAEGYELNLGQIYISKTSTVVSPSNLATFSIVGLTIQVDVAGGDEAYGDIIRFSEDCDSPKSTDYFIERKDDYIYTLVTTKNFELSRTYRMCLMKTFMQGNDFYMDQILTHTWTATGVPELSTSTPTIFYINEAPLEFDFDTPLVDGDKCVFAWKTSTGYDCETDKFLSPEYEVTYGHLPLIWLGNDEGISGIANGKEEIHMCWKSNAYGADSSYSRVTYTDGYKYKFVVYEYTLVSRISLPELSSIWPTYGSTELYDTDATIQFNFESETVTPAKRSGTDGKIGIYRGAVTYEGEIVMDTSSALVEITTLDEADGLTNGPLTCNSTGNCEIVLSAANSNQMVAGELYFLALYPDSFSNNVGSDYYLFANSSNGGSSIYNSLFASRSFNIPDDTTKIISGNTLVIEGINLDQIANIKRKSVGGSVTNATFETQSIKISLKITSTTCSSDSLFFASIDMKDVNATHITINNLDLKDCDNGQVEADFTLTRGIKTGLNSWAYLFTEFQKGVILGQIGDDSACSISTVFMYDGLCVQSCPSDAPYWREYTFVKGSTEYVAQECVESCGIGYYVDIETNECAECNLDCQTCIDDKMNACVTCSPIKYYYKGMCTEECPAPAYESDNTNYQCIYQNTSYYMDIEILKPPYLHKIPKNEQFYLKAYINNSRGSISNVTWTQISPPYSFVPNNIYNVTPFTTFTMDYNPITYEPYNSQLTLKMRMTAFTYIAEVTSIKIKFEATNSYGDTMTDLVEFYINSAPHVGTISQQILTGENKPISGSSQIRFRTSDWYDSIDDDEQTLSFMFYYVYNGETFLLKNAGHSEMFDITLPYISTTGDGTRVTVSACVLAYDKYLAADESCINLKEVLINYDTSTLSTFIQSAITANMSDANELLYTSSSLEVLIPEYIRSPVQPHICTVDYQCYNGVCEQDLGTNYCKCNHGFFGMNCQYKQTAYYELKDLSNGMLSGLYDIYKDDDDIGVFDFHIILTTLKSLLKDPDMIPFEMIDQVMDLFERCSSIEGYKAITLRDFSLTLYFKTAERILGKIYFERKMLKAENQYLRFKGMTKEQIITAYYARKAQLNAYGENAHDNIMNFLRNIFARLHLVTTTYTYLGSLAFELKVQTGFPPDFEGDTFYIKESDIYWDLPYGLFDAHQNVASYVQQIYVVGIKWIANPFIMNNDHFSQLGTNTTALMFFDNRGDEIKISGLSIPISMFYPYSKNTGYSSEFLQCQYYDTADNAFKSDGCGKSILASKQLPCTTCAADDSYTITDVLKCRCSHLTTVGGIFKSNSISTRDDPRVGICVSYFALNYWDQSFGYYLCWPAISVYLVGLVVAVIFDLATISHMKQKIITRIKAVGELNKLHKEELKREEERKQYLEQQKINEQLNNDSKQKNAKAKTGRVRKIGKRKRSHSVDSEKHEGDKNGKDHGELDDIQLGTLQPNNKKRKLRKKKKPKASNDDAPMNNFLVPKLDDDIDKHSANSDNGGNGLFEEDKHPEYDETGLIAPPTAKKSGKKKLLKKKRNILSVNTKLNPDGSPIKPKGKNGNADGGAGNPQENGNSREENKEEEKSESSLDTEEEIEGIVDDSGEKYRFPTTVDVFEHHRSLWSMIAYSNPLINAFFITSYLCPRHIRATMLFSNTILIWFLMAVYYNNTKDPLVVPDFEKKARNIASDELLIAMIVPIFTMTFSYVFWGIFKVKDQRFHQSDAYENVMDKKKNLMKSLLKEMYLRFGMAYFIMIAIYGAVLWYIVNFTAKFGWKVSWQWWYSGSFAFFINYFIYDPCITWFHYTTYGCSEIMWRKIMSWRSIKIACPEVLDDLYIPPLTDKVKEYLKKLDLYQEKKKSKAEHEDAMI